MEMEKAGQPQTECLLHHPFRVSVAPSSFYLVNVEPQRHQGDAKAALGTPQASLGADMEGFNGELEGKRKGDSPVAAQLYFLLPTPPRRHTLPPPPHSCPCPHTMLEWARRGMHSLLYR